MNMLDYLTWRGDLTFAQSGFCEVDNLLFCYLIYVNLDEVAPKMGEAAISIRELSRRFFERYTEEELEQDKSFIRFAPHVLKAMAQTDRFGNLLVQNYVNKIDFEKMLQFAAIEILLGNGTRFIAYRGTDDTIVGWKEDFNLSRGEVPSEKEAVRYLNEVGNIRRRGQIQDIRIGGHSKGGNLAVYAAACCEKEVQDRILEIYDNDGPGFVGSFIERPEVQQVRERIRRYIPESSVIGMLLEHAAGPVVVQSTQKGVMQHDAFSWEVSGTAFVRCEKLSNFAEGVNKSIREWLAEVKDEQRRQVIEDLFAVLEATEAATLTELQDGGLKNIRTIMKEIEDMNSDSKGILQDLFKKMIQNIPQMLGVQETRKERKMST